VEELAPIVVDSTGACQQQEAPPSGAEPTSEAPAKPKDSKWRRPKGDGQIPARRGGHAAAASSDGKRMVLFGGADREPTPFNDVYALHLRDVRWEKLKTEDAPSVRSGHAAAMLQIEGCDHLFVFGGQDYKKGEYSNDLHVLNMTTLRWSQVEAAAGSVPAPRTSHSCVGLGTRLFVFGGSNEEGLLGDLHVFDAANNNWTKPECGEGPQAREMHACAIVDTKMYVIAGRGAEELLGDVWLFDTETLQWQDSEDFGGISERCAAAAATVGGKIYLYGGTNGVAVIGDMEILDTGCNSWLEIKPAKKAPPARFAHTAVGIGSEVVVFGGITFEEDLNDIGILPDC